MLSGSVVHGAHQSKALSPDEERDGFILTCCAVPTSDLVLESRQVTEAGAFPIRKMPSRVSSMVRKAADVMVLQLQMPANDGFVYHAGQYIDVLLTGGLRRSYSMANAAHTGPGIELHIRHMAGGRFTDQVFERMKEKEILRIEGPFGSFYLREESAKPIVLLASGTGFAPIKALLENLHHLESKRTITLYWGGRRPADLYMADWVHALCALMPTLTYVPVVSDALPEDQWTGRTGFVHQAVLEDHADLSGHQVYACGAPIVVDSARRDFCAQGLLPPDEFFADSFTSEADKAVV
jgi:CDP-4-dehydro-6-deoxyglucose reductase